MKILIWARFSTHHFAIRNVILNICSRLYLDQNNRYTIITNSANVKYFSLPENAALKAVNIDPDSAIKNHLYSLFILPFYIFFHKFDLVIFPQITFYLFRTSKILFYIHDLIEYKLGNQRRIALVLRKLFYKRAARISDHIITVSLNSKQDIISILKYPESKISVIYNGRDEQLLPLNREAALEKIRHTFVTLREVQDYFLYVGYLAHPQKNLLFVLDGIEEMVHEKYYFLLIGPDGKDAALIHDKIKQINNKIGQTKIVTLGTVDKELLPSFYSAATCFLFPSLYEGFGMPVIEAMACACPVITSNTASLKEIAENYAWLIDPRNKDDLRKALREVIAAPRRDLSFYEKHLKQFTWENHVLNLIKTIIGL